MTDNDYMTIILIIAVILVLFFFIRNRLDHVAARIEGQVKRAQQNNEDKK